jgi:RNA polymerase sigma-70 factor (ECF subfamily)
MDGPIDAELLGRLLDEHGPALALYAAQWTNAADDCVQEALVELARQPRRPEHVLAWLYRVVKNRALNAARGNRRRRERELHAFTERLLRSGQPANGQRLDHSAAVEALKQLNDSDRELIVMRIWGELTFDEIASSINTSTSTAFRQYERALTRLRKMLESPCSTTKDQTNEK